MDDINTIIKSLDSSGVLSGVTETVKREVWQLKVGFHGAMLPPMSAAMLQLLISSVVKDIAGRGVMTAGRGYYNNIDHIDKAFYFHSIL